MTITKQRMASYLYSSYILVAFSLLFLFFDPSFARVSVKISKVLLNQLCSKADDPNLCVNILSSDPRTETADLQGLLGVSINLCLVNATENYNYIRSVLPKITDPELKRRLSICSSDYERIVAGLDTVATRFIEHDYQGVYVVAGGTGNAVLNCMDSLKAPPSVEPTLTQRSLVVDVLIDIILAIASQLDE